MIIIKKRFLLILLLLGYNKIIFSQVNEQTKVDSAYLEFIINNEKEYQDFTDNSLREYKHFEYQYNEALRLYQERIYKIWGKKSYNKHNSKEIYTEYSDDFKSRMTVNFKNGNVTIESVIDDGQNTNTVAKEALNKHMDTKGKYVTPNLEVKKLFNNKLLKYQSDISKQNSTRYKIEQITGDDCKKRKIAKLELKLAPNHIKKRAELFLPAIQKYSQKYNVRPELVLAMMHTESYFNPKAKSAASA